MDRIALVAFLKPFMAVLFLFVLAAAVIAVRRWLPEGKLKRLLLKRIV